RLRRAQRQHRARLRAEPPGSLMAVRRLTRSPAMLGLYGRAAASMLPGASRLPLLPGGGGAMPRLTLTLEDVAVDPLRLVSYKEVCEFGASQHLPCTYPH